MNRGAACALAVAFSALCLSIAEDAYANNGGLPGYTGKPTAIAPQGESCNQCHSGGAAPTVVINGPASLNAGQSAEYQLVVTTGLTRVGGGVAGSDGVKLANVAGFRDSFGEMVQDAPLTVNGGSATFRFTVTAPSVGTTMKLWGVGLAANNSGNQTGDRATQTTKDVTIVGGAAPSKDAGTGGGSSGGTSDGGAPQGGNEGTGVPVDPATGNGTGTGTGTGAGTGAGDGTGGSADTDGDGEPDNAADESGGGAPPSFGPGRGRSDGGSSGLSCAFSPIAIDTDGLAAVVGMMAIGTMIARRRKR